MRDLETALEDLENPFAAFVMTTFHEPFVAEIVADAEAQATRVLGFVPCPHDLPHGHGRDGSVPFSDPCPSCGAAL